MEYGIICLSVHGNNKTHQTGRLQQQTSVSHSSGGWKSTIKMPAGPVTGEVPLPGWQMADSSLCPHMVEREQEF